MHGRKEFPFVVIAGVGFPNGHSNPVRLAVVAIDPVDLYISQMPPDSIGQSVADQSFEFVGGQIYVSKWPRARRPRPQTLF